MGFGKFMGEIFKPKNMFSRVARVGGGVLGAYLGGPQGAMTGYNLGDKLAGTFEKDGEDSNGFGDIITKGKLPSFGGRQQRPDMFNLSNQFNRGTVSNEGTGVDIGTILNLLKMSGKF